MGLKKIEIIFEWNYQVYEHRAGNYLVYYNFIHSQKKKKKAASKTVKVEQTKTTVAKLL